MKHRWYKAPVKNLYNGRMMSVPYGADEFHIECCELRFSDEILGIYRPYVEETAVSFELDPPSVDEFTERVRRGLGSGYPWLLACVGDRIVGYAYAQPFRSRAAYARSVEMSIYLMRSECRKGYGRQLYFALENELRKRGYVNAYACITCCRRKDPFLTQASIRFHASLGYSRKGRFDDCAKKFGRLYSIVWMGKRL